MQAAARWRTLVGPSIVTSVALAILVALGVWQLERRAWKDGLSQTIAARAYGEPGGIAPEASWADWRASVDEFRRVQIKGRFLHQFEAPVHGLMPGQRGSSQGYYLFTPLEMADGALVVVNRGFVPIELRDPALRPAGQVAGDVTVTGLVRAPERQGWFVPENDPAQNRWFLRDPAAIAAAHDLARVAPFYIDADATENPGGWPRGGQTRLALPNNHLQYALTWFGLALTLVGVFAAWSLRRLRGEPA
jgi:surfeit locus 1 family protein